jgi:NitT/TauT family transport system substrate-binding protein
MLRGLVLGCFLAVCAGRAAAQEVRVGYWASGASAALGIVLDKGGFLQAEGLQPHWVTVTKLAEVNRALIANSIDIALSGGTLPTLLLGAEGVPARIIMANMIAEANFVVPENSPIRNLADLKGKKIGSTPPGSTMYALVSAILTNNYGLAPADFTQIPSGEAQLLTFLQRGDIDAAVMRTITLRALGPRAKVRVLANVPDEWERLIGAKSPPVLGMAVVNDSFETAHADLVVKFLVANIKASRWGAAHTDEVAAMLSRELQMAPDDALALAKTWSVTYFASLEPSDITSLLRMADIFKADGSFQGDVPARIFFAEPFRQAKAIADKTP